VSSHPEEHLEVEPIRANALARRDGPSQVDQPLVMGRNRWLRAVNQQPLEQPRIVGVNVGFFGVRHARWLQVGAFT